MRKTALLLGLLNSACFVSLGWFCFSFEQRERIEVPQTSASHLLVPQGDSQSTVALTIPNGMKPVFHKNTKVIHYLATVPVRETHEKVVHYTVMVPVHEMHEKVIQYTVKVPVYEAHKKVVPYTVTRHFNEPEVQDDTGNEPTSSRIISGTITEQKTKTVSYTTCKMVTELRSKNVSYQTCKMVPETRYKNVTYTTCRMVTEPRQKCVDYETVEFEPIVVDSSSLNKS